MPATHTVPVGNDTSTPWPTYTPPPPSATPPIPPPPPGYYADCNRPTNADPSWWLEYEKCQILSFFTMSPNAVATAMAAPTLMANKEPMGLFQEIQDTRTGLQDLINQYDWNNTGLDGTGEDPSLTGFVSTPGPGSPLVDGNFNFNTHYPEISHECQSAMGDLIGPRMAEGACFIFNALRQTGVMPWLQIFIDITAICFLLIYLIRKWVDPGVSA